jgi:hypothetical protein
MWNIILVLLGIWICWNVIHYYKTSRKKLTSDELARLNELADRHEEVSAMVAHWLSAGEKLGEFHLALAEGVDRGVESRKKELEEAALREAELARLRERH